MEWRLGSGGSERGERGLGEVKGIGGKGRWRGGRREESVTFFGSPSFLFQI